MVGEAQFTGFSAGFAEGTPQLVSRELVADTLTPVSAYLKLAREILAHEFGVLAHV